jgi:hypothetical protein
MRLEPASVLPGLRPSTALIPSNLATACAKRTLPDGDCRAGESNRGLNACSLISAFDSWSGSFTDSDTGRSTITAFRNRAQFHDLAEPRHWQQP